MMSLGPALFYVFAAILVFFALSVIMSPNPVHSALYLVLTMISLAGVYFHLNAQFIAGVQLIVYAGAVMVLFVMVIMLFDIRQELRAFSKGLISGGLKVASAAFVAGYLIGTFKDVTVNAESANLAAKTDITRELALMLYSKYVLAFEILGLLLLVVAVGAVAVSRVKGGTHAKH